MKHDDEEHGARCYACGGAVNAKGMAMGGEIDGEEFAEPGVNLQEESTQREQAGAEQRAARRNFVRAVKATRRADS